MSLTAILAITRRFHNSIKTKAFLLNNFLGCALPHKIWTQTVETIVYNFLFTFWRRCSAIRPRCETSSCIVMLFIFVIVNPRLVISSCLYSAIHVLILRHACMNRFQVGSLFHNSLFNDKYDIQFWQAFGKAEMLFEMFVVIHKKNYTNQQQAYIF